jgi:hypothetical protein
MTTDGPWLPNEDSAFLPEHDPPAADGGPSLASHGSGCAVGPGTAEVSLLLMGLIAVLVWRRLRR